MAVQELAPTHLAIHLNTGPMAQLADVRDLVIAAGYGGRILLSHSSENQGFCKPINEIAARLLTELDAIVLHNPDLGLEVGTLRELSLAADGLPGAVLLGPLLLRSGSDLQNSTDEFGRRLIDSAGIRWTRDGRHFDARQGEWWSPPKEPFPVDGLTGACLYVSQAAFRRFIAATGELLTEEYFAYREDAELGLRARALGIPCFLVPAATASHVRAQRGAARGRDPFIDMLGVRNRLLMALQWGRRRPGLPPVVAFRDLVVIAGVLLRERSSLPALREAWHLRSQMRAKRDRLLTWSQAHPDSAP